MRNSKLNFSNGSKILFFTISIFLLNKISSSKQLKFKVSKTFLHLACLILISIGINGKVWGQSGANYTFATNATASLTDMSSGTTDIFASGTYRDDTPSSVTNFTSGSTNPFIFHFMGGAYDRFSVNSNGQLRLGNSTNTTAINGTAYTTSAASGSGPILAPISGDNSVQSTGKVHFKITGNAPSRIAIIEWNTVRIPFTDATNGTYCTFQCRLYENTGAVEFVYGRMYSYSSNNTVGWFTGATTTTSYYVNDISGTLTNTGSSTWGATSFSASSDMTNLNSTSDGSRRIFSWTPSVTPSAPTTLSFTSVGFTGMTLNWSDQSTNEYNFAIYNSTDGGTTWNYVANKASTTTAATGGTAYTYAATGLTAGTTYQWRVYAVSEGKYSAALSGSQATSSCSSGLSGTKVIGTGGDYTTLTAAINAINSSGVSSNLILELNSTYTSGSETFPLTLANSSGCLSSSKTVTIRPASGATARTITSANTTATIDINGGQYWIIDGRSGGTGSTRNLSIGNTGGSAVPAIRFINEANNNTIQYCTVTSSVTSTTSGLVVFSTTTGANGNDNNTIDNCDLNGNATAGNIIYASGSASPADNSGNIISNNLIRDFFLAASADWGINISSGNTAWTISGNSIYQSATRTQTTAQTEGGINISNTSGNNFTISGNFIGGTAASCGGTAWTIAGSIANRFRGISLNVGTTTASSVQGNTIANFNFTSTSGSTTAGGPWVGIYLTAGNANIGNTLGNTIGSGNSNGSIVISIATNSGSRSSGIFCDATNTVSNISNNTIGSITFNSSTISQGFSGIVTTAGTTLTINNNTIGSTSTSNSININTGATSTTAQVFKGISNTSSATISITNNTVANVLNNYLPSSANTSNHIVGIESSTGTNTITGNTIRNLSTAANATGTTSASSVIGISVTSTAASISQNSIYAIANTHASAAANVIGLYYVMNASSTMAKNNIYNISASNTSAIIYGAYLSSTAGTVSFQNNFIRLGYDAAGNALTTACEIHGVYDNSGANNFYFNSIYLGGTGVGTTVKNTYAFNSLSTSTRNFRNNIFVNARSNSTTGGKHYAVKVAGTGTNPTGLTINYNDYFANGTGGVFGFYSSADVASLTAWKTAIGQDVNSLNVDPTFTAPTSSTPNLHASSASIDGAGISISGITDDFDSDTRNVSTPDIGADEFSLLPSCATYTSPTDAATNQLQTGVTLQWSAATNATSYDVYFGTDNPPTNVANGTNQSGTSYATNALSASQTYYWKIVPKNAAGSASGCTVWSFTTQAATPTLSTTPASPTALAFGNQCQNSTSSAQSFTMTALNLTGTYVTVAAPTGFSVSENGTDYYSSINVNHSSGAFTNKTVYVKFTPGTVTSFSDNIAISGGGLTSNVNVPVTGTGVNNLAGLSYTSSTITYCTATAISTNSASLTASGGTVTYSVNPSLPGGLSLNTSSGAITGTPSAAVAAANYTVTASNTCSNTATDVNITVITKMASLSYTSASMSTCQNSAVTTNTVSAVTGSGTISYSIDPALPSGMTINSSTGAISGTPTVSSASQSYTVTASNGCSSTTANITISVSQTLSGTYTVGSGGNFATLTAAVTAYNNACLAGAVIFSLTDASYSAGETFPIAINANSYASATNTLTIRPASGVAALSITSSNTTATIDLNGGDYIYIDGRAGGIGSKVMTIENSSTSGSAIRFVNDASYNEVRHTTVRGVNTSASNGVIFFSNTTGSNGNDNNTIDNCDIRDGSSTPLNCIYSLGTTTSSTHNNSGNTVSNCNIFNFYSSSATSQMCGIFLSSGTTDWNITGNSFYQTTTRTTFGAGVTFNAILVSNSSGNNFTITDNYVGGTQSQCGGTALTLNSSTTLIFRAFQLTVGTTTATSLQNNTIANISVTTASTSTAQSTMSLVTGSFNCGNITGNTIGSQAATGNISFTQSTSNTSSVFSGILAGNGTPGTINISNNLIGGILCSNSSTGSVSLRGISIQGAATGYTVSNNIIGSISTSSSITNSTNSTTFGIHSTSSSSSNVISNNTIANISNTSTGSSSQIIGITTPGSSGGAYSTTGNTIRDLTNSGANTGTTSSASVIGISHTAATTAGQTLSQNTIYSLSNSNTATTSVIGINYSGPTTGTNLVQRNLIYGLAISATSVSSNGIYGIYIGSGTTTFQNNFVSVGNNVSGGHSVNGIYVGSASTNNFYHNSVYIGGTGITGLTSTHAFYNSITNTRIIRNNIFVNARSNGSGSGSHYSIREQSTTGLTINNNIYWTSGTGGILGILTSNQTTLTDWQSATGQDANSYNNNPQYIDPTNATPDLHLSTSLATYAEGNGANLGVTDDYDGQTRSGLTPVDIGADAGNFIVAVPPVFANMQASPSLSAQCTAASRTITIDITTATGTISTATLNYSHNGVAQSAVNMTNTSGNTWSGVMNAPSTGNASVTWSISATNSIGVTATYTGATYSDEPNTGFTATATATQSTVCSGNSTSLSVTVLGPQTISGARNSPSSTSNTTASSYGLVFNATAAFTLNSVVVYNAGSAGTMTIVLQNSSGTQLQSTTTSTIPAGTGSTPTTINLGWNIPVGAGYRILATTSPSLVRESSLGGFPYSIGSVGSITDGYITGTSTTYYYFYNWSVTAMLAQNPTSYSWSDGTSTVGSTNPLTVSPTSSKTYTATATVNGCPVVSSGVAVTVNPLPTAPTASPSSQCGTAIPTASVTDPNGFTTPTINWYSGETGGSALQSSTSTTYSSSISSTTTFHVSIVNPTTSCESSRTSVTASVNPAPTLTLSSNTGSNCQNSPTASAITLTAGSSDYDQFSWSPNPSSVSGNSASGWTFSPSTTTEYTLQASQSAGSCQNSATVTITTTPLSAGGTATAAQSGLCQSGSTTINLTGNTGTIQWQSSADNSTFNNISGQTSSSLSTGTITSTTYYRAVVTNGICSATNSSTATVTVNNPQVLSTTPGSICAASGTVNLAATASPGATLNWYAAAAGGESLGTGTTFTTPTISSSTNYYVCSRVTTSFSSLGNTTVPTSTGWSAERGIVFTTSSAGKIVSARYYSPSTNVTNSITVKLVNNSTGATIQTLSLSIAQGASASWYTMNLNLEVDANTTYRLLASFSSSVNIITTANYTLSSFNNLGQLGTINSGYDSGTSTTYYPYFNDISAEVFCQSSRTAVTATVTAPPSVSASANSSTICNGQSTTLTASSANAGYTYSWSNSLGSSLSVAASPTTSTTYTVTATDNSGGANNGCTTSANVTVTVNSAPAAVSITPSTATVCSGEVTTLVASGGAGGNGNTPVSTSGSSGTLNLAIPDNSATGVSNTLSISNIPSNATISKIDVTFSLDHAYLKDAEVTLTAPNGKIIALAADQGPTSTGSYSNTVITSDNSASALSTSATPITGTFKANATASGNLKGGTFSGNLTQTFSDLFSTPNGNWIITAFDDASGDLGTLVSWSINITYTTPQIIWSSTTGLYTNSGATSAYTGSAASTVYAKPSSTTTYTATATGPNGCTSSNTATITVNQPTINVIVNNSQIGNGDYLWNGNTSADGSVASNWYVLNNSVYSIASAAPTSSTEVFIINYDDASQCVSSNNAATIPSSGTFTAGNVYLGLDASMTLESNSDMEIYGDFVSNGTFSAGTGTVSFKGSSDQHVLGSGILNFNNLVLNTTNNSDVILDKSIGISGDLTFLNGNIDLNGFTLTFSGVNITSNNGGIIGSSASSKVNFASTTQITSSLFSNNLYDMEISGNSSVSSDATFTILNDLNINDGSTLILSDGFSLTLKGDLLNFGTISSNSMDQTALVMNGNSADQEISGNAVQFSDFILNKSSNNLTLNAPLTITNSLTMTSGNIVVPGGTNILEIGTDVSNPGIINWTGGSVLGPMKRWFAASNNSSQASGIFPVGGDIPGKGVINRNAQVNFTGSPSQGGYIIAEYITGTPMTQYDSNGDPLPQPEVLYNGLPATIHGQLIENYENEGYWDITPYNSSGDPYSALNDVAYTLKLRGNSLSTTNDFSTARIIRSPGPNHDTWEGLAAHVSATGTNSDFTITSNVSSGFSWFNMGSGNSNPLPVELTSFTVQCESKDVLLNWSTASEQNSSHFDVEKSNDGSSWRVIGSVSAAGNSTQNMNYSFVDSEKSNGQNYYRLNQVDIDGENKIYGPIQANCVAGNDVFMSFPNPSDKNGFSVVLNTNNLEGNGILSISDLKGNIVYTKQVQVEKGISLWNVSDLNLTPGVYFIQVVTENNQSKVIKHVQN